MQKLWFFYKWNVQVADQLQVLRIGKRHQAGSDSLLTAKTFFKLKERFFADNWDEVRSLRRPYLIPRRDAVLQTSESRLTLRSILGGGPGAGSHVRTGEHPLRELHAHDARFAA